MASSSSGDEDCVSRGHSKARGRRKSQKQPEDMEEYSDLEEEQEEEEDVLREKTSKLRRQQRQSLREIVQDTHKHREEITLPDELLRRVKTINKIFKKVEAPREAAIDAEGFQLLSAIAKEQVESCAGELVFDPIIFTEKLVTFMGGRRSNISAEAPLNWAKLGERVMPSFRKPPHLTFLHGALDVSPFVKKERQRRGKRKQEPGAAVSKPKELSLFDEEEESTTKSVGHILKHLKLVCSESGEPVHYFTFLVDPHSFPRTVENLFHFSFLVKDGRAGIVIDSDGQPYVHLPSDSNPQSAKSRKNQAIMSINHRQWKRAIEKFKITWAQIPVREQK